MPNQLNYPGAPPNTLEHYYKPMFIIQWSPTCQRFWKPFSDWIWFISYLKALCLHSSHFVPSLYFCLYAICMQFVPAGSAQTGFWIQTPALQLTSVEEAIYLLQRATVKTEQELEVKCPTQKRSSVGNITDIHLVSFLSYNPPSSLQQFLVRKFNRTAC